MKIVIPDDFTMPPGGLNIRNRDGVLDQEARLQDFKRDAMLAFVRANNLNRIVLSGGRNPKIGIITVGKSYLDVRQALDELGLDEVKANDMGLRLYKVACPWPLSQRELVDFARGLDMVIVVEEKRSLIEVQLREELYGTANQPLCIGKKDEEGNWLFPVKGALDPNDIAIAIGERLLALSQQRRPARPRRRGFSHAQDVLAATSDVATRTPHFCSGCPHNTSTKVPEGMRAYAGIGCHYMVQWMDRSTDGFTQMGGEGANWIGEAPFSKRGHVFQNLGDGTYNHSGVLALRWSIAHQDQRHLQDPVQRRGRHDRRAAARGRAHRRHDRPPGARGRRRAHRARHRRAGQISRRDALAVRHDDPSPQTNSTPCSASWRRSPA